MPGKKNMPQLFLTTNLLLVCSKMMTMMTTMTMTTIRKKRKTVTGVDQPHRVISK